MNLNLLAYSVFLSAMIFIIGVVGRMFYRNGRAFILGLLNEEEGMTDRINHLLLVGYYLFNIGYSFLQLQRWEKITTVAGLISGTASKMGLLILLLAGLHYMNIAAIYVISKSRTTSSLNQ